MATGSATAWPRGERPAGVLERRVVGDEVDHTLVAGYLDAVHVAAARGGPGRPMLDVDLAANYTSFQDARGVLRRAA